MNLDKIIQSRRSKRKYLNKEIKIEHLGQILDLARYAPSAGNMQNWRFIVVTDKAIKNQISQACLNQFWMDTAPVHIIICGDLAQAQTLYSNKAEFYTIQSCANSAMLMQLKAEDLGLSTCWVSSFNENAVKKILKIPEEIKPIIILTLGYSKEYSTKKKMNPLSAITFFDKYGNKLKEFNQGLFKSQIKKLKQLLTKKD